jgi:hypothetical protein
MRKLIYQNIDSVSKLAIVFKDLDDKMHSSTDYVDLLMLTNNWIERSGIIQMVDDLISRGFTVFLTSDHGNIQAKGWRGLQGREKLGTNNQGAEARDISSILNNGCLMNSWRIIQKWKILLSRKHKPSFLKTT